MESAAESGWRREGRAFVIDWAGEPWRLGWCEGRFGLHREGESRTLLSPCGVSIGGVPRQDAIAPGTLVDLDVSGGRVLVTFDTGCSGLLLRAAWGLCREGKGMDLEVQATASSVGEIRALQILVESDPGIGEKRKAPAVRDEWSQAAAAPILVWNAEETGEDAAYLEMAHCEDVHRWLNPSEPGPNASCFALFGLDLEKGVVLRARLRGIRLRGKKLDPRGVLVKDEWEAFLSEPLPLRTS